ncbi:MAG: hypothetical protein DHS20C15_17210 [Planctomycetota bacterium]|nr:MAG: hypothetical protein DHS20C15_17210 [Planctomycetota bacterium]
MLRRSAFLLFALLLLAACASSRPAPQDAEPGEPPEGETLSVPARPSPPATFQAAAPDRRSDSERLLAERSALAHITVTETQTRQRDGAPLSFGVPFARGRLHDATQLRAWVTNSGAALPVQTRVLSRWPDNSLRWVLVDTRVALSARAEVVVAVGLASDLAATPVPWSVEESPAGELKLHDGDRSWTVLRRRPEGDEIAGLRALLVDRFGLDYVSRVDGGVKWVEWGPLRATARLRGAHRSASDNGLDIDFHSFTVFVHFLAGLDGLRVEWSLENGPLHEPPGRLAFRSYELLAAMPSPVPAVEIAGRSVQPGSSVTLTQTASGEQRSVDGVRVAPSARLRDAWIGLRASTRDGGQQALWVHREDSAANHPNGFVMRPTEPLRIGLLSPSPGTEFWLDDATRKTFYLNLSRGIEGRGQAFIAEAANPPHVALDPLEVRLSKAWGDAGLFVLPTAADLSNSIGVPRDAPTGWADWGERSAKNTHQTGSPRNRLSVFLEALQTGRADLFRWNMARARHAMDMRPYHIQGFSADEFPDANLYEGVPHWNERPAIRLGRSEMSARFVNYKHGLPEKGHGYNGFDPEHMALDDVYEAYLLTGSWQALDALQSAGEAMLTWWEVKPGGKSFSSRSFGWTLRALIQVHRATGDPRILDAARRIVHRQNESRGQGDTKWFIKQKPDGRHLADKEWDSPWMVAIALHGLAAYFHETADPIVPPLAADLSDFCLSALRGPVFMPDIPIDGSEIPVEDQEVMGVSLWVPGGLAAAAFITGDHRPVDRALGVYEALLKHRDKPLAMGTAGWIWWQTYRVSLRMRYGAEAAVNPARVRELMKQRAAKKQADEASSEAPPEDPSAPVDPSKPRKLERPR